MIKSAECAERLNQAQKRASRGWNAKNSRNGHFRSPKFRITCIIRNSCNQKTEAALLSFCQISGSFCGCYLVYARPLLRRRTYYQYVQAFDLFLQWSLWYIAVCIMRCLFHRQRFCAEVCTDGFVINACHCLAALFTAKMLHILVVRHKALLCQHCRTIHIL